MKTDDLLLRQTRIHFPRFDEVRIAPLEKGGSDRKFYRVRCSSGQTVILVKYSLDREENCHYVRIAEFLTDHDIRAPKIYYHDPSEGLIWIEDLGTEDLFGYRNESWLVRRVLYESALDEIVKLHRLPESERVEIKGDLPAEFNAALYRWEQNYFFENCLERYFKMSQATLQPIAESPALETIAERLASLPRVLVHRDFQSQNIIVRNGQAHLIDFQGMRPGLPEYDIASLLYDPYVDLSETERGELIEYYRSQNPAAGSDEILLLCAMQRLMQALGAYGFLGLVKGHKHFLQHIPKALSSLRAVVGKIENLALLRENLTSL